MKTIKTLHYKKVENEIVNLKDPNVISQLQSDLINSVYQTLKLFSEEPHLLTEQKNRLTGNKNNLGFYMIYNKKLNKFYLGSSIEFSLRVADYNRDFRNFFNQRKNKLYKTFVEDIQTNNCNESDFYFVPLISFSTNTVNFINLDDFLNTEGITNNPLTKFLETIEFNAINHFIADVNYSTKLYNKNATGKFVIGNQFRSPKSGSPSQPVKLYNSNYVWESVSLAAQFLGIDRHTVRNKLGKKFDYITLNEFKNWDSNKKITKENIVSFTEKKQFIIDIYKNS